LYTISRTTTTTTTIRNNNNDDNNNDDDDDDDDEREKRKTIYIYIDISICIFLKQNVYAIDDETAIAERN
jgi:hypothetical protein